MKTVRLLRWSGTVLTSRVNLQRAPSTFTRFSRAQATAAAPSNFDHNPAVEDESPPILAEDVLTQLPSPPVSAARSSAKLSALHSRLSLPSRFPIETLARTLVDSSADSSPKFNNKPLSVLGNDLLGCYTSEYIICQYPRLPLAVVYAAMYAYVGPKALAAITREWGVQHVAEPGGEVDPGLLQFLSVAPKSQPAQPQSETIGSGYTEDSKFRRTISSRVVYDDAFGELKPRGPAPVPNGESVGITLEAASANFVRAVIAAIYLHAGRAAAKRFYREHFMSRQLDMSKLFRFKHPTRDLSRLCAREGFQSPVARVESETGRQSRHPVYVVGVYSGHDKLGEGVGASLDEARTTAAVAALKGWYLYSPLEFRLPSEMEEPNARPWVPLMVDPGDVV